MKHTCDCVTIDLYVDIVTENGIFLRFMTNNIFDTNLQHNLSRPID